MRNSTQVKIKYSIRVDLKTKLRPWTAELTIPDFFRLSNVQNSSITKFNTPTLISYLCGDLILNLRVMVGLLGWGNIDPYNFRIMAHGPWDHGPWLDAQRVATSLAKKKYRLFHTYSIFRRPRFVLIESGSDANCLLPTTCRLLASSLIIITNTGKAFLCFFLFLWIFFCRFYIFNGVWNLGYKRTKKKENNKVDI